MVNHLELIDGVKTVFRHPAADIHGLKTQLNMLAEAVIDVDRRHHRPEEVVSTIVGKLNELRNAPRRMTRLGHLPLMPLVCCQDAEAAHIPALLLVFHPFGRGPGSSGDFRTPRPMLHANRAGHGTVVGSGLLADPGQPRRRC
jgi:hypothetical protein